MTGLTRKQAAALAGVSEDTIRGWVVHGHLVPISGRPPRYTAADVHAAQVIAHAGDVLPRWRANPLCAGQRLRRLHEAAGLNQQQLAHQAELSHEHLSRLELGTYAASAPTVHQLSQALGVAPTWFVDDSPIGLELLTTEEAGRRLDVPGKRVRKWMRQGVLPGIKIGMAWPNWSAVDGCVAPRDAWTHGTGDNTMMDQPVDSSILDAIDQGRSQRGKTNPQEWLRHRA